MFNKKGQKIESPTVHVAIFISLIILLIVFYLLIIPKAEREKLLGTGEEYYPENYSKTEEGKAVGEILLSVSPGGVYPYSKYTEKKDLASISLYSTMRTSPIMLADNVVVTKSFLVNGYKELIFDLDNLGDLSNLGLFFNTGEAKGDLIIELNGNEIYKGRVLGGDLPVELPVNYLKEFNNKLVFEVSHPGFFILSTNKFTLKDVQLIKQVQLENKVEFRNFVVDKVEGLKEGSLGFFVNCLRIKGEQGVLRVGLNGRNVYVGKVVCDAGQVNIDLIKDYFVEGLNTLSFDIDKGEYALEQTGLELDVEERNVPQYYFAIDEKEGEYTLKLNFEETDEIKRATITINGDNIYLDEYGNTLKKDVTTSIREGENYIKIIARNEFVIDLLEIVQE